MAMRLGFAVAISLDPDILIIDEVLAVGDEHFRGKCFAVLNDLRGRGKTIIFVSHDLATIRSLCNQVVFVNEGRIAAQGKAEDVADTYLNWVHSSSFEKMKILNDGKQQAAPRWGSGEIEIQEVTILNAKGEESYSFYPGEPMEIRATYHVKRDMDKAVFGFNLYRNDGTFCLNNNHVANSVLDDRTWSREKAVQGIEPHKAGDKGVASFYFDRLPLVHGIYRLTFSIYDAGKPLPMPIDEIEGVKTFQVVKDGIGREGIFLYQGRWEFGDENSRCFGGRGL
jgi:ABC-2 type transport system ATP-binding protein/lipopolysaccharide transport system ATP-binding protein